MTDTKPSRHDRAIAALAAADTKRTKALLDTLAARAELAGMPARQVAAIRRVHDLADLLEWPASEVVGISDRIAGYVAAAEGASEHFKARQS